MFLVGSATFWVMVLCSGIYHTLLPAIEPTNVIRNTENKQVQRNMSRYFQHIFMLFPLCFGYLFYDTFVVIILCESCIKYCWHNSDTDISTFWWMLKFVICRRILYFFLKTLIYAAPSLMYIKYLASTWLACCVSPSYFYAPGLKGPPGASSNRIVRLSVRPSVCLSACP